MKQISSLISVLTLLSTASLRAELVGINFAGDANLAASQSLTALDTAGLVPQKLWNNASGNAGQMKLESDPEGGIGIFYSSFMAQWQGLQSASANIVAALGNQKMMKGMIAGVGAAPAVVQIGGIPTTLTQPGYVLLVYCDSPNNTADVVIKCTVDSGGQTQTLYLRDAANSSYSGSYTRAAFTSSRDAAAQTPTGNVFIFRGLTASDAAVLLEPGSSSPNDLVGITGIQIVPASRMQLTPRITSALSMSAVANEAFAYSIEADLPATSYDATGLPSGLVINRVTGKISGVPTGAGTYSITLKAVNVIGTASEAATLLVQSAGASTSLDLFMVPAVVLKGNLGQTFTVESSDAIGSTANWKAITTIALTNSVQLFVDLSASNSVKHFYRSRIVP